MTPDEYTIQESFLDVGDGHTLYVHEWGNKDASVAVLVLHGGPGSSAKDHSKLLFDPARQHVIFYDQRGCGKSTPYGSLEHNTTRDLIADINKILDKIGIQKVILTGGSWGSTLALAYALAHPQRVHAMVLTGSFTGSQDEINWLDKGQIKMFYPDAWARYLAATPTEHQSDPSAYHFARILGNDPAASKQSCYDYENLEASIMKLDDRFMAENFDTFDPAGAKMEVHYLHNRCFMPDRYILDNAHTLTMPVWLIQGRYDIVCPPSTAHALHQALPHSELIWTISNHYPEHESWNFIRTTLLHLTETLHV